MKQWFGGSMSKVSFLKNYQIITHATFRYLELMSLSMKFWLAMGKQVNGHFAKNLNVNQYYLPTETLT